MWVSFSQVLNSPSREKILLKHPSPHLYLLLENLNRCRRTKTTLKIQGNQLCWGRAPRGTPTIFKERYQIRNKMCIRAKRSWIRLRGRRASVKLCRRLTNSKLNIRVINNNSRQLASKVSVPLANHPKSFLLLPQTVPETNSQRKECDNLSQPITKSFKFPPLKLMLLQDSIKVL
jgi:hypothetical protein